MSASAGVPARIAPTRLRWRAAAAQGIRPLLCSPARDCRVLARFPSAVYLRRDDGAVLALLTRDAVRVPCGLVLAHSSHERPLHRLDGLDGPVTVGGGELRLGEVTVTVGRVLRTVVPRLTPPSPDRLRRAGRLIGTLTECPSDAVAALADPGTRVAAARRLVGRGSGLTPSGDDVLAGFLAGSHAFGVDVAGLVAAIEGEPLATTDLSAALLRHAARGEAIPQLVDLVRAMAGDGDLEPAVAALRRVGHTSGPALALGALAAAGTATACLSGSTLGAR